MQRSEARRAVITDQDSAPCRLYNVHDAAVTQGTAGRCYFRGDSVAATVLHRCTGYSRLQCHRFIPRASHRPLSLSPLQPKAAPRPLRPPGPGTGRPRSGPGPLRPPSYRSCPNSKCSRRDEDDQAVFARAVKSIINHLSAQSLPYPGGRGPVT